MVEDTSNNAQKRNMGSRTRDVALSLEAKSERLVDRSLAHN